jgi:dolichol-phosphate mannosyltransferase
VSSADSVHALHGLNCYWLVLPTYNERENIESIVRAALRVLDDAAPDGFRLLIVDDGSPDGTGAVADALAEDSPYVEVLHRPEKEGLGPAYIAGFGHALTRGASHVIQMDADFSHDPADLARLIAASRSADLVLGSRYTPGGCVEGWTLGRRLVSRGGCVYARTILRSGVRDLTGGFKCFRRAVLESIDIESIQSRGYGFQIELTYRALAAGFDVVEIPITFRDRKAGKSKMSAGIALEAARMVPLLPLRERARTRSAVAGGQAASALTGLAPPRES